MIEIELIYVPLTILLAGLFALYFLWKLATTPNSQPIRGISKSKWGSISWLFFAFLTIEASVLTIFNLIWDEAINFRIGVFQTPISNLIDIIIIVHIFLGLLLIISRVTMFHTGELAGKLFVQVDVLTAPILFLFLPTLQHSFGYISTCFILGIYALLGGSILIIVLSLIPIILTKKFFEIHGWL